MNMTSRRKTKKNSNEGTEERRTPRKRGRADNSPTSSAASVTPPETGRGQRRSASQTSPSPGSQESPPRKTRRGATTPDTPQRTSPRGRGTGRSPAATKESPVSPRGRGQRSRRGSTDSSASSVGNASVASSSTPSRRRRRRESNSSGVSATSESSQVTPPTRQTSRGRKRNKSNSPPAVLSKKTNGASPQYPPRSSKRRKTSTPVGTPAPAANGRNGRRTRGRRGVSETPPLEDLDGGTDDEESSHLEGIENSTLENSTDSLNPETSTELHNNTSHNTSDVEKGDDEFSKGQTDQHANNEDLGTSVNEDQIAKTSEALQQCEKNSDLCENEVSRQSENDSENVSCQNKVLRQSERESVSYENESPQQFEKDSESVQDNVTQKPEKESGLCKSEASQLSMSQSKSRELGVMKNSEKQNESCETEHTKKCHDTNFPVSNSVTEGTVAKSRLSPPNGADTRTCDEDVQSEVSNLTTSAVSSTNRSSHMESAKRRQTSGESSDSGSPEVKPKPSKKARLNENIPVPDIPDSEKTQDNDKDLSRGKLEASNVLDKNSGNNVDRGKCEEVKKTDRSESVNFVKSEVKSDAEMDTLTQAEIFLESLSLTEQQTQEICSVLPASVKDSSETRIVESLVETLLDGSIIVTTMNAPRFNKFLRQLLTHYCNLDTTKDSKHSLCEKAVQWARDRKSVNLRHELELTLMSLYYSTCHFKQAEAIASALYSETKKLQDKEKTVKACLCLSQVYHAMGNISKARANITTAKTEALKIYTPPDMQGELDLQSGIMQVAEGKDMETAYSYFKEAATGFTSRKQRARALKYMLLSKIMVNRAEEGEKAVRSQSHVQDIDEGVEAMLAIANAANRSSLAEFRTTREQYGEHLAGDMVVASVLDDLYTTMMEKNLLNIVLPYERLQIGHIADRIGLPREEIERRLSQMILDKRINAQLDHRDDCLYVYASEDSDIVYQTGLDTLSQLDKTVSHLNRKVKKLL